jgi:hypothetical protein
LGFQTMALVQPVLRMTLFYNCRTCNICFAHVTSKVCFSRCLLLRCCLVQFVWRFSGANVLVLLFLWTSSLPGRTCSRRACYKRNLGAKAAGHTVLPIYSKVSGLGKMLLGPKGGQYYYAKGLPVQPASWFTCQVPKIKDRSLES